MPDKPPSSKQKPKPHVRPGFEHYGEPGPVRYPDSLGKRAGGWLFSLLTPWKR